MLRSFDGARPTLHPTAFVHESAEREYLTYARLHRETSRLVPARAP